MLPAWVHFEFLKASSALFTMRNFLILIYGLMFLDVSTINWIGQAKHNFFRMNLKHFLNSSLMTLRFFCVNGSFQVQWVAQFLIQNLLHIGANLANLSKISVKISNSLTNSKIQFIVEFSGNQGFECKLNHNIWHVRLDEIYDLL